MNQIQTKQHDSDKDLFVPAGWKSGKLSDFLELQRGIDLPVQDRRLGEIPILGSNGLLGFHDTCALEGPGVITGRSGTIGKVFYIESKYWPLNTSLYVKNFKENRPKFIYYKLTGIGLEKFSTGTGVPTLNRNVAHKEAVAFPPISEQEKIAAILTTVDDKLDLISRQIEATQSLKQGLMQTLFSRGVGTQDADGRWLPHTRFKESEFGEIPADWMVNSLENVADVERGKFSARPRNDPKYFDSGDIPFIQTGDIAAATRYVEHASQFLNKYGLDVSKRFPAGTIFITIAANIGEVAIAKIPMACPDSVVGIRPNVAICDNTWLYYLLENSKDYFDSRATQNAQKNINLQVLKPFSFPMPTLLEQRRIANILTALDDKFEVLTAKQKHYQTLKRGLMQKLLTGEWRVSLDPPAPPTETAHAA